MSYPALITAWSSQYANATFIEVLDCLDFSFQNTQLGGPGAGKFSIFSKYEDSESANLLAANRIDAYVYRDTLSIGAVAAATTCTVHDGTRFSTGQRIALYDGVNQDFVTVSSVSGNVVTFSPALANTYALQTSVMLMGYRGRITARERTGSLDYVTRIETMGYFAELNDFVIDGLGINARECGWAIYNLLQQYANSLDLTINSSNFVMTTDTAGLVNGTGTNVAYTTNQGQRSLLQVLQEIVKQANSNNSNITYQLYCDVSNTVYFKALPTTTPTVNLVLGPQAGVAGDGITDILGDIVTRDQDITNVINTYKLVGGKDKTGTPVQCEVFDQTSVNQYGQKETVLSVPSITDLDALKAYGQARLDVTAYPVEQSQITLNSSRTLVTAQDFVAVTGFQNLAPNSDFLPTSFSMPASQQWSIVGANIASNPNLTVNGLTNIRGYVYTGTGSASGTQTVASPTIGLLANQSYKFSGQVDPSHISAGSAKLLIMDPSLTTTYGSVTIGVQSAGRFACTYTPTGATNVKLVFSTNNCTVTNAQPLSFCQPLLENTAQLSANNAAGSAIYIGNNDLFINVQTVDTQWTAGTDVKQIIKAAELVPDKNRIMGQIAAQHYIANLGTISAGTKLDDKYVQTGLLGSIPTNTSFALSSGVLFAKVLVAGVSTLAEFDVAAFSFSPSSDGLWMVAYLFSNADGTLNASPSIVYWQGATPPSTSSFTLNQVIPLYRVTRLGGVITQAQDVRNIGGIQAQNIINGTVGQNQLSTNPSPTTAPALKASTSLTGPTYLSTGGGTYEAVLAFTLAAPPQGTPAPSNPNEPGWMSGVRMVAVPHGASFAGNGKRKGDLQPSPNGYYQAIVDGCVAGSQYDIYCVFLDTSSYESAPLLLCTTAANPLAVNVSALPGMPANTAVILNPINVFPDVALSGTWTDNSGLTITRNATAGPGGTPAWSYTGTGSASGSKNKLYGPFNVAANQNGFTLSMYIDATHVTAGSPQALLCDATGTTIYATASQTAGTAGVVTASTWTPGATITNAYLMVRTNNCTVANATALLWAQPDVFGIGDIFTYPNVGSATCDCDITLALNNGTTAQPWLEQIEVVAAPSGSTNWTIYNEILPNSSGAYTIPAGGLGAGQQWDMGLRYKDFQNKRTPVLFLGTTVANPIQGSAVAPNTIQVQNLGGTVVDVNGQLQYVVQTGAVKSVITGTGGLNINPVGGVNGNLPLSNNSGQVTSTILPTLTNGSYLAQNIVTTSNIAPVNVTNTLLYSTRYDTSLANRAGGSSSNYQWYDNTGAAYLAGSATLTNGRTYTFDCGNINDITSGNPQVDTYTVPANGTVTLVFKHAKYTAGGNGLNNIYFTGNSVSAGANVIQSTTVTGSDQPTITHTTTDTPTNDPFQTAVSGFSSTATVTQTANTGYNNGAHSGSATAGSGSNASVTVTYTQQSSASTGTGAIAIGRFYHTQTAGHWVGTGDQATYIDGTSTDHYLKNTNANMGVSGHLAVPACNPPSAARPVGLNYSGLSSSELVGDNNLTSGIDSRTAQAITWTARCYNSNNTLIATVTGLTGSGTCTTGSNTDPANTGSYYWTLQGVWTVDDGTQNYTTWTDGGTYVSTGYTGGTTSADGGWVNFVNSGASTVAPVDAAHQLSLLVNTQTAPSDANGSTRIDVALNNPANNTTLYTWTGVTNGQNLTWSNGSAVAGQYLWLYKTTVISNAGTGSSTYNGTINATPSWFENDPYTYYSYPASNGAISYYNTSASAVAPTSAATQISLSLSAISCGSASSNTSEIYAALYDPNGNNVANYTFTATGTANWFNAGAVAGVYQWRVSAAILNNAQNGTVSLTCTATGLVQWYQYTHHYATNYALNAGAAYSYTTPATTIAPTVVGSALTLNLSSVTAPADSYGNSQVVVYLKDPSGAYVTDNTALQYSTNGGSTWNNTALDGSGHAYDYYTSGIMYRYYKAAAAAGTWTWIVYGAPFSPTGDSSYNCSWSGTHSWYLAGPAGGNTYVLAQDGVTQRLATTDQNILLTQIDPQTIAFQVSNNASSAVSFQIALDSYGV